MPRRQILSSICRTLDTVTVALLPTFTDLHKRYAFDLDKLSTSSDVSFAVIDMMLQNAPVSMKEARLVLQIVSRMTGENYTPDTVDVKTVSEVQHG